MADLNRIDPTLAGTPEDFVLLLRQVRTVSSLSYWDIEQRAHQLGFELTANAIVNALGTADLPPRETVKAILAACGCDDSQLARWLHTYDQFPMGTQQPAPRIEIPPPAPTRMRRAAAIAAGLVLAAAATALAAGSLGDQPVQTQTSTQPSRSLPVWPSAEPSPSAAPPSPSPSPSRSTPPTASPAPTESAATLSLNQGLDLDSGRVSDGAAGIGAEFDIAVIAGGLRSGDYERRLALMPQGPPPSLEQCSALNPARLDRMVTGLDTGHSLCILTTDGHWARLTITAEGAGYAFRYLVYRAG